MTRKRQETLSPEAQFRANMVVVRLAKGITQERLAEAVGLTRMTITNIERGISGIPLDRAVAIADALGTTLHVLLGSVSIEVSINSTNGASRG